MNAGADASTSWRSGNEGGRSAATTALARRGARSNWNPSGSAAPPMRSRWDQPSSTTTTTNWRRANAPPLLPVPGGPPVPPIPSPTAPNRAVPLLPLPTDARLLPGVDAGDKRSPAHRRWSPPRQNTLPLAALHAPIPSGAVAADATMSRHGIVVPDELVFTRASCSPELLETLLKHFIQGLSSGTSYWSIKLHSQVVLQLAAAKNKLEKNSPAYNRASKVLGLLHRYRQRDVIELLPYHPCDDRSRNAEEYLPCIIELTKRIGDYSKTIFLTNLDPNSRMGKMYENSGISVMSLDVLLNKYDIK
uniref:TASOR PIN domain-containing protein n=1 Tax=Plectus sambesii TaxID=2011161 RepID=A0A914VBE8_9BILA